MRKAKEKGSTTKLFEVEDPADLFLHRPVASVVVQLLLCVPKFSPCWITISSLFTGGIAAFFMYNAFSGGIMLFGTMLSLTICFRLSALFMYLTAVVDCCDGQYARAIQGGSFFGRMCDGVCDMIVMTLYSIAFCLGMYRANGGLGFICAVCACFALQQHALLYDKMKNFFVLKLKEDPELSETTDGVLYRYNVAKKEGKYSELLVLYIAYYYVGLSYVPIETLQTDAEKDAFRNDFGWNMRLCSFLGIGTQATVWYVVLLVAPVWPGSLWFFCFWQTIFNVGLNAYVRRAASDKVVKVD